MGNCQVLARLRVLCLCGFSSDGWLAPHLPTTAGCCASVFPALLFVLPRASRSGGHGRCPTPPCPRPTHPAALQATAARTLGPCLARWCRWAAASVVSAELGGCCGSVGPGRLAAHARLRLCCALQQRASLPPLLRPLHSCSPSPPHTLSSCSAPQCLKTTQTSNPFVLIDEIDKLGRGYQASWLHRLPPPARIGAACAAVSRGPANRALDPPLPQAPGLASGCGQSAGCAPHL